MARDRLVASNPEEISTALQVRFPFYVTFAIASIPYHWSSSGSFASPALRASGSSINAQLSARTCIPS